MDDSVGREIRVFGIVQGVGFRPTVWRLAREAGLVGDVRNDSAGVHIRVAGRATQIDAFTDRLRDEAPPLSRIDRIEVTPLEETLYDGFQIVESATGTTRTQVAPDAAVCAACSRETLDRSERRFRYPFTNCTHCGPRFSIVCDVPYDRARTSMSEFEMCDACRAEYSDPADRRFHAQPIACHTCGPRTTLLSMTDDSGLTNQGDTVDDIEAVVRLVDAGRIVAVRGLGGFHLMCDATRDDVVQRLRTRKRRDAKPFALMGRDLSVVERYCTVTGDEAELLQSPEAPIVLLRTHGRAALPSSIAPGLDRLGFMLPYTPLHQLLLEPFDRPVVMTSANLSDAPQVTKNEEAVDKLRKIADFVLFHDRDIVNRIDDSVVRVTGGRPRILRRARGYAPAAISLPDGFEGAPDLLAFGGELKSTFCLLKDGAALVSQHQGDLEDLETFDDYTKNLGLYQALYEHAPEVLVADRHPDYLSSKLAHRRALEEDLPLVEVQHHHAHIAACLAENRIPLDAPPVLGVALDGLGYGDDGTLWGGEFLLADYTAYRRLATFKPVRMLGGAQAIRQPWRSLYAHLMTHSTWPSLEQRFGGLSVIEWLAEQPRAALDRMLAEGLGSPWASSCGRLFDAVAAAVDLCRAQARFEAEGAMRLEAMLDHAALRAGCEERLYPFSIRKAPDRELLYLDPQPMWQALLDDLNASTPTSIVSARFHGGLCRAIVEVVAQCVRVATDEGVGSIALSGGCFQNAILLERVTEQLVERGFEVLTHGQVPTNDGGLSLGQAAVAAALRLTSADRSRR